MKYLHQVNGRWAVRIVVPPSLRSAIGRIELREWLGSDKKLAKRSAHLVIAKFLAILDQARAAAAQAAPTLRTAAQYHFAQELLADDRERGNRSLIIDELRKNSAPQRTVALRLLIAQQISSEEAEAVIGYAADAAIAAGTADRGLDRGQLLRAMAEVQLEAMARFEDRDAGRVNAEPPRSPLLQPEEALEPKLARNSRKLVGAGGPKLSELLLEFHKERAAGKASLAPKTMAEHSVAVRMLEEFLGSTVAAAAVTKDDLLGYKRALMNTPTNYRLRFPGKTLPEAIEANAKRVSPFKTLDPQTINGKWLGC